MHRNANVKASPSAPGFAPLCAPVAACSCAVDPRQWTTAAGFGNGNGPPAGCFYACAARSALAPCRCGWAGGRCGLMAVAFASARGPAGTHDDPRPRSRSRRPDPGRQAASIVTSGMGSGKPHRNSPDPGRQAASIVTARGGSRRTPGRPRRRMLPGRSRRLLLPSVADLGGARAPIPPTP